MTDNVYYQNYSHLPSRTLRQMLTHEGKVPGDPERFSAVRDLLRTRRTFRFHTGRTWIEKDL